MHSTTLATCLLIFNQLWPSDSLAIAGQALICYGQDRFNSTDHSVDSSASPFTINRCSYQQLNYQSLFIQTSLSANCSHSIAFILTSLTVGNSCFLSDSYYPYLTFLFRFFFLTSSDSFNLPPSYLPAFFSPASYPSCLPLSFTFVSPSGCLIRSYSALALPDALHHSSDLSPILSVTVSLNRPSQICWHSVQMAPESCCGNRPDIVISAFFR